MTATAVGWFLPPCQWKEIYTACECVEPFYKISAPIHSLSSVPTVGSEPLHGWKTQSAKWQLDKPIVKREGGGGGQKTCGSFLPFLPPTLSLFCLSIKPPQISAVLSDATLQSKSAILTSKACKLTFLPLEGEWWWLWVKAEQGSNLSQGSFSSSPNICQINGCSWHTRALLKLHNYSHITTECDPKW